MIKYVDREVIKEVEKIVYRDSRLERDVAEIEAKWQEALASAEAKVTAAEGKVDALKKENATLKIAEEESRNALNDSERFSTPSKLHSPSRRPLFASTPGGESMDDATGALTSSSLVLEEAVKQAEDLSAARVARSSGRRR